MGGPCCDAYAVARATLDQATPTSRRFTASTRPTADIETGDDQVFLAGTPQMLFDDLPRTQLREEWDLAPEGQAALIRAPIERDAPPEQITVVVNWLDELKRLVDR